MEIEVREVWESNVREEMDIIASIKESFPFVAFDTEFPGFVVPSPRKATRDQLYSVMKSNVDDLKLIQVGLALFDEEGNLPNLNPDCGCVWQFNLCDFDASCDRHSPSAIKFLKENGIDFEAIQNRGIDSTRLCEEFWAAGLIANPQISWLCFHGTYDFAYMLKLVEGGNPLPLSRREFTRQVNSRFCNLYDLKYMATFYSELKRGKLGLRKMAEILGVEEYLKLFSEAIGEKNNHRYHQAGWDSLVTGMCFFALQEIRGNHGWKESTPEWQVVKLFDWNVVLRYSYGVIFEMEDVSERMQMIIMQLNEVKVTDIDDTHIVSAPHMEFLPSTSAYGIKVSCA